MEGQFIGINDGYGIVGYTYICPQCSHETTWVTEAECAKCGFKEEGEPD